MGAFLVMLGLLAFLGIGVAVWVIWGGPGDAELRRGGTLIGMSFVVVILAMALVLGLQPSP